MIDFFSTMINRHLGTVDVVKPRSRARFEPESGSTAAVNIPTDHRGTEQSPVYRENELHPFPGKSSEVNFNVLEKEDHLNIPVTQEQCAPVFKSEVIVPRDRRKVEAPNVELPQQRTAPMMQPGIPSTEKHEPPVEHRHYETLIEKTPPDISLLKSELEDRIEGLLQRLRGPQNSQLPVTGAGNPDQGNLFQPLEMGERDQDPKFHTPSVMPSQEGREEMSKPSKQQIGSLFLEGRKPAANESPEPIISSTEPNPPNTGSLELPSWLSEMQAAFSQRWQKMHSNSEAEPVINVTIGRVEVRAVQTESPKQSKRKNKPVGVMSLDEYLSQRGRGGRV
jgi:hypothetical protein